MQLFLRPTRQLAASAARYRTIPSVIPSTPSCRCAVRPTMGRSSGRCYAGQASGISGLTAEDRFEIVELCHRFDHAINRMDQAATGPMFASSASLITPKGPVEGRDAIVAFFTSVAPLAKGNRHLTLDVVVDPAEMVSGLPSARAASYRLLVKAAAPTSLVASGTIDDEFIKENGMWKFVSRKFVMDAPSPDAAASQGK